MKKIISIILCLAMIFAMAATAFAATDTPTFGTYFAVKKVDGDNNPLPGAKFGLFRAGDTTAAYEVTSDIEGIATFVIDVDGFYTLKEIEAPAGYEIDIDEYTIEVENGLIIIGQDEAGNVYYNNQDPYVFVNEKIDDSNNGTVEVIIPVTKVVEQTGFKAPGAETFTFEVFGFENSNQIEWSYVSNTVETNGAGTYEEDIIIETEDESLVFESFYIKEIKGTKEGWTYSEVVYKVNPVFDNNGFVGFEFETEENGDPVTYDEAVFVNSYYEKFNFAPMNPSKDILDDIIDIFDDDEPEEPAESAEENPDTGAPVFALPAAIAVICGAALLGKRK